MAKNNRGKNRNKNKNKNKNKTKNIKQTTNLKENGQASAIMAQENPAEKCDSQPVKRYLGLTIKTWTVLWISSVVLTFLIFLIVPYIIGLCIAATKGSVTEFLSGINYFTIFLSILGTAASVLSIVMTFVDRKRYDEEKAHSEKLLSKLTEVSVNIETIQEENHSIKLEVLQIKDKIKMSKEVKEDTGKWASKEHSGEVNDDKHD